MNILPKQTGVALGLLAFTVASLVSIFSGVSLGAAIMRSGGAFFIFLVFGWLIAYLIYETEEEKEMAEREDGGKEEVSEEDASAGSASAPVDAAAFMAGTGAGAGAGVAAAPGGDAGGAGPEGLDEPDDSDF